MSDYELDRLCPVPPDPDALPRVLSRAEALEGGMSRQALGRRTRSGAFHLILPRTLLTSDTLTARDRLDAALCFAGDGAALSGLAALWASDVKRVQLPERILVVVPRHNRTRSRAWVQIQRSSRLIVTEQWTGLRRVEVARAAADVARTARHIDDVRALISRVVQDRHCTLDELAAEVAAGPQQGSAQLRRVLQEVASGAGSAPEARAARILRRAGIRGFEQNVRLTLRSGRVRVVDFYWPRLRAVLELDSVEWHFEAREWRGTLDRHFELTTDGYAVVHRPPSALHDERQFAMQVQTWLTGRAAELGLDHP